MDGEWLMWLRFLGTKTLRTARRRLLGISPAEATVRRRGFRVASPSIRRRLEEIGAGFLAGYHAGLEESDAERLGVRLKGEIPNELQGFAFEGAAMALTLLDLMVPGSRTRLRRFLDGPAQSHVYMTYVGAGWALARLRRSPWSVLELSDPLLRWLALDGYGFHQGYFDWPRYVDAQARPSKLSGYALRAFDQGLGRSLWFVEGAQVQCVQERIGSFSPGRQPDLWAGVGLAAAYAGGVDLPAIQALDRAAGAHRAHLAQGVAFAAGARGRAGNPAPHTDLACHAICGIGADEAARACEDARRNLLRFGEASRGRSGEEPSYEFWRERLRLRFAEPADRAVARFSRT
jgi:hypothetical protein